MLAESFVRNFVNELSLRRAAANPWKARGGDAVFLFIVGERLKFAGSVSGLGGILLVSASFLPRPVQPPDAYFLPDDTWPQGLLSPGKDEDGRRDGTRLKAPSQILTRATRTTSVLHALDRRLRDSSLRSLFHALVLLRLPSAPSPRVFPETSCSSCVSRFRKDFLARRRSDLDTSYTRPAPN